MTDVTKNTPITTTDAISPQPPQPAKFNRVMLVLLMLVYVVLVFSSFFFGVFWAGGLASYSDLTRGQTGGCISGVLVRASVIADNDIEDSLKERESVVELPDYCYPLLEDEQPDALEFFYDIGGRNRGESRTGD